MKDSLVSVNMATYNHAPFIARAIEGVLQQEVNFPFELVIGEDCSTDGTREIVFEYHKKYPDIIRVITSERNVGAKQNLSRIRKNCLGKYVAFCEGDDYWHNKDKLQKQVDYLEMNDDCGLVHSDYDRYFAATGKFIHSFNKTMDNTPWDNLDMSSILRGGKYLYILTCTVVVRNKILFEIMDADPYLYQSDKFLIGDTPAWAEIAWRSKTHYINESLATYTVNEESASKSKSIIKILRFGMSFSELKYYLVNKYNLSEADKNYFLEGWCHYALRLAFYQRDKILADEVRKKKKIFNLKDLILFLGAKNILFYYLCYAFILLVKYLKKIKMICSNSSN